ncbi:MAG: CvpA family protein [Kiritimatiellae bacterium]|nr:CvpA family protein [Kiritimatiellia bacterium]
MNIVDYVAIGIVLLGLLQGYHRRFSGELAHLISVIGAFILGLLLYRPFGGWLIDHTRLTDQTANVVAFITTMIVCLIIMTIIRLSLRHIMRVVIEEEVDKTLGAIAGFLRVSVFIFVVFLIMNMWPNDYLNSIFGEESFIGRTIVKLTPSFYDALENQQERLEKIRENKE